MAQAETERYLNHVVDRFDLRRHMRFGARVTSATFDELRGLGGEFRRRHCASRFVVAATGVLSRSTPPTRPGRVRLPGRGAPHREAGRRRPSICRQRWWSWARPSSGVQVVPAILDDVEALYGVLRRHRQLVHPAQQRHRATEQARLRAGFGGAAQIPDTSVHGFHHRQRLRLDDSRGGAAGLYEKMWPAQAS